MKAGLRRMPGFAARLKTMAPVFLGAGECIFEDYEIMAFNPIQFIEEVRSETAKVTWPTWKEVWITSVMVLIMVIIASFFFLAADQVIGAIIKFILTLGR